MFTSLHVNNLVFVLISIEYKSRKILKKDA